MKLYSIFDEVSKTTIFLNLHHNDSDAVRSFRQFATDPRLKDKAKDLSLYFLCDFNPSNLSLFNFPADVSDEFFGYYIISADILPEFDKEVK